MEAIQEDQIQAFYVAPALVMIFGGPGLIPYLLAVRTRIGAIVGGIALVVAIAGVVSWLYFLIEIDDGLEALWILVMAYWDPTGMGQEILGKNHGVPQTRSKKTEKKIKKEIATTDSNVPNRPINPSKPRVTNRAEQRDRHIVRSYERPKRLKPRRYAGLPAAEYHKLTRPSEGHRPSTTPDWSCPVDDAMCAIGLTGTAAIEGAGVGAAIGAGIGFVACGPLAPGCATVGGAIGGIVGFVVGAGSVGTGIINDWNRRRRGNGSG